ncbi:hypothetical protein MPSEU_000553900 [Mayamaea pseudoterrestris]|nr:hypothetical protein MPSEU_000553900 [Mayamaea pseudoterrestris]
MLVLYSLYGRMHFEQLARERRGFDRNEAMSNLLDESKEPFQRAVRLFQSLGDVPVHDATVGLSLEMETLVRTYGMKDGERGYNIFANGLAICQRFTSTNSTFSFIHAPIVLAAYKEYLCRNSNNAASNKHLEIVDMTKYALRHFTCHQMHYYLHLRGGCSLECFQAIASGEYMYLHDSHCYHDDDHLFQKQVDERASQLAGLLRHHGPALVRHFKLDPQRLMDVSYSASDTHFPYISARNAGRSWSEQSAMLLVGVRKEHGEWRVLLQHWWPCMPFVEVSAAKFYASAFGHPLLTFVSSKDFEVSKIYERCNALNAQANVSGCDRYRFESSGDY